MSSFCRTLADTVYSFDELDDHAKENAREWYRSGALDYDWWEPIYEDAKVIGALMGIEIDDIGFSGFWNKGDGAHFEGSYSYRKGAVKAVANYAPEDTEIIRIARKLQDVQRGHFYKLEAAVKHRGHYEHEYCTDIGVYHADDPYRDIGNAEDDIKEALRDFMRWIYRQIEQEYEYLMSDEAVDESIRVNGYKFDEEGILA